MRQVGNNYLFCWRKLINEYDKYTIAIVTIDHFKQEEFVGYVPLFLNKTLNKLFHLPELYATCKVTGTRINRGIGLGLEKPIEMTFNRKEMVTEWLDKTYHCVKTIIDEKVSKCKKWTFFFNERVFCNPALSLSFPIKKLGCPSYISKICRQPF